MSKKVKKNSEIPPKQEKNELTSSLKIVIERCRTPNKIINGASVDEDSSDSWTVRSVKSTRNRKEMKQDKDRSAKSGSDESEPDEGGRCSPEIPRTEPSMRWYGTVDMNNKLIVTQEILDSPMRIRTPLKNLPQENSALHVARNSKQGCSTITLDEDSENEIPNKRKEKCISKSRKVHERKLNEDDISRLLEEDDEDDDEISRLFEDDDEIIVTNKQSVSSVKKSQKNLKSISPNKSSLCRTDDNTPYSQKLKAVKEKKISVDSSPKSVLSSQKKPLARIIDSVPNSPRLRERVLEREVNSPKSKNVIDKIPNSPRLRERVLAKEIASPKSKNVIDRIPNSPRLRERVLACDSPSHNTNSDSKYAIVLSAKKKLSYDDHTSLRGSENSQVETPKRKTSKESAKDPILKEEVILKKQLREDDTTLTEDNSFGDKGKMGTPKKKNSKKGDEGELEEELQIKALGKTPRRRKRIESSSESESETQITKKRFKMSDPSTPVETTPLRSLRKRDPSTPIETTPLRSLRKCEPSTPVETTPLRSLRKRKPNMNYDEDQWEMASISPKKKCNNKDTIKSKESPAITRTVEATPRTPKSVIKPSTPASRKVSARRALLTPSMPVRTSNVATPGNVLEEARARLHVSAVPKSLPCREKEFQNIYRFLQGKILDGLGGCMYISGVPGTGKTATVQEVVRSLRGSVSSGDLPDFQFIELNGMRLTEPRQAYVQLLKQLTGQTMAAEQAQQLLERRFSRSAKKNITTLLLVDELDLLWTRRQDVVYNLLDWPTKASSHLVVLTIANTMDLPERILMGRVTSRLGLTRVTFHPYTHKQLQEIVLARLGDIEAFDPDAVQLVSRKVAAVSGDARRALDICRRAAELAEMDTTNKMVEMKHVDQALEEMVASSKVQAIRFCSKMEQLFLQAVAAEVQRTGVEETIFNKVCIQLRTLCTFDGLSTPSITEALGLCARLGSCRLLLTEHSRNDIHQRVLLNVSCDDIHYALKVN